MTSFTPLLAALAVLAVGTLLGVYQVRKMIIVAEARHELRQGSAGFLRSLAGWSIIIFWLMTVWFCGTVIGDWYATGDFEGAADRSWLRLRILLEIAAALADAD